MYLMLISVEFLEKTIQKRSEWVVLPFGGLMEDEGDEGEGSAAGRQSRLSSAVSLSLFSF